MRIDGVFQIKGRGTVATVTLDGSRVALGVTVRRVSDGAEWRVKGIDRFAIPRPPGPNDRVGLLVEGDARPEIGDEIVVVDPAEAIAAAIAESLNALGVTECWPVSMTHDFGDAEGVTVEHIDVRPIPRLPSMPPLPDVTKPE